jgi:biopolymer transport protein TolQ
MRKLYFTLPLLSLPAYAFAQEIEAPGTKAVWEIIIGAGMMVKFVLIVLVCFSVVSWAIIALKYMQVRAARKGNERFMSVFWGGSSLEAIQRDTRAMKRSPLAQLFQAGYQEISKSKRKTGEKQAAVSIAEPIAHALGEMESVERALRRASSSEMGRLERYSSFLATTGSTAPFVGLFGTVWGIMNSFRHIATMGKVGMDVVAPGISEALIATAFGLAAAIPAVVAYNYFVAQTRGIANEMDSFTQDLLNIVQRYFL